jgi:dsDNA-specific endonuclease/ATPase MutS2
LIFDLLHKIRLRRDAEDRAESSDNRPSADDEHSPDSNNPFPEPVIIPFQDVLDLHSIPPRQVRAVVADYIEEAHTRGVRFVRIIHGKGIGVQREMVRAILSRTVFVVDFKDAPSEAGGWGATIATLSVDDPAEATRSAE